MKVKVLQEGEAAPTAQDPTQGAAQGTPEGAGGTDTGSQDPMMQIVQLFVQGLQNQDCASLSQGAQMFIQLVQSQQGAQAGGPQAGTQPVFAKGGKFKKRIKKELPSFIKDKQKEKDGEDETEMAKYGKKLSPLNKKMA